MPPASMASAPRRAGRAAAGGHSLRAGAAPPAPSKTAATNAFTSGKRASRAFDIARSIAAVTPAGTPGAASASGVGAS